MAATKADLEITKNKLQSTVGDLGVQSGLIARNHDEVEELEAPRRTRYFEFDINKTKEPSTWARFKFFSAKWIQNISKYTTQRGC